MDVRIVLIAKGRMVRECLRTLLEANGSLEIVGELGDLELLEAWARDHEADVAVFDASGADLVSALATLRRIADTRPEMGVVVNGTSVAPHWLRAGAAAALQKNASADELRNAVLSAARREGPGAEGVPIGEWESLSDRQRAVMRLAAEGLSSREIGIALGIGSRTVETHRACAMKKLGVRRFHEALLRMHWTSPDAKPQDKPAQPL